MDEKQTYEVAIYDTEKEKFIYEKTSDSFIIAAPKISVDKDGNDFHDVHLMIANLHPKVTAEICLALIQQDPLVKQIFVETIQKMNESEGDQ